MNCRFCNEELILKSHHEAGGRQGTPDTLHKSTGRVLCRNAYADLRGTTTVQEQVVSYVTCQKEIIVTTNQRNEARVSTYCQRRTKHDGECSPNRDK